MSESTNILLAFYGDDFTGSTDALEFISRCGAKAVLFTEPPSKEQLESVPGLQVYGIAGKARALAASEMEAVLIPAFESMKQSGARHIHYKVCSTFDSSPGTGSIGKAMDCGSRIFRSPFIPVLGGSPSLGRYCLFGNLFARMGIGSLGKIYRLDRHPSMSRHPVTPAEESDLRLHLGRQTKKKFGLIDVLQQEKPVTEWEQALEGDEEAVLLDALHETALNKTGNWLDQLAGNGTLFSTGGSGIEAALGAYWNETGLLQRKTDWPKPALAETLLVVSGSCSPVTTAQIAVALNNGFAELVLDPVRLCKEGISATDIESAINLLAAKPNGLIVHTGKQQSVEVASGLLGAALGTLAKELVAKCSLTRLVIAGGDSSSFAARALGIDAVEMLAPLVSGAPLCMAYSKNESINGLEVNFKGGQVGAEDYFLKAAGI